MSDWCYKPLGSIAEIRVSNVDKKIVAGERPVRLCNYMDVYANSYVEDGMSFMEASATDREISSFALRKGDVLITKDSESPDDIGIPAVVDGAGPDLVCGYHLAILRPDQDVVDPAFLMKQLETASSTKFFGARAAGSTRYALSLRTMHELPIRIAPRDAQAKIARILRLLDGQIEQTEALIAKQERVRAGLLQDLFTRGVDQNGALRPPREEAPDLYHQTELGWLPKGWDATRVGSLFELIYRYPTYYGISYVESGVPEVRGELILDNGTLASSPRFISSETAARFPKIRLELSDIVMSVRGTIGKFATVSEDYVGGVITANLLRLKPRSAVRSDFLMHLLKSSFFQERLETACSQTTIRTIQMPAFCDILVPMAPEPEQTELALILNAIRAQIESEVLSLEKLRALKSALMQDLLTGRVSVAPLLQSHAA